MKSPKLEQPSFWSNLRSDFPASIIVFLVAVPLCLGIALASGAPLFSGVIAGIIGGIVVGALSGSQLGVSGPAAGLAVIVLNAITELGSFEIFLSAVVVAGVIQVLLGFLKAGIIGYYFPSSVIKGMLSGIGIIIILKQIPHAFGYDKDYEGSFRFLQPDGENTLTELGNMVNYISVGSTIVTLISLGILILWEQPFMKRVKLFKIVQGPLVVVLGGIFMNLLFQNIPNISILPEHLVQLPVADSLNSFLGQFTFPDFSAITHKEVLLSGLTLAMIASLETLLSVEATDKLDPLKRVTPTNRELKAQGIGNIISGLIGGLPLTQVIVRSSANIQSGAQTKLSAILHGLIMLVCAMTIPNLLNLIPLASLAAILLIVGYKLAKPVMFQKMFKLGWSQFLPFVVTILGIVFTDLLIGIGLGLVVAIFFVLYNNYKNPYFFYPEKHEEGKPITIHLSEDVSFLNKASILQTLNHLPSNSTVYIDASKAVNIDYDVLEIIEDFKASSLQKNIEVRMLGDGGIEIKNPVEQFKKAINNSKVLDDTVI